ncbi:MAG: glycosyltransferase [Bryobacteraceae bacterium]|jgi:ceramide glucosyltransferase
MSHGLLTGIALGVAAIPAIYYLIVLYSGARYFHAASRRMAALPPDFTPPVSSVKPIRGLDPDAYENFASLCRQDYPEYEILFCVDDREAPVMGVIEKLRADFPGREIRVLFGSGRDATNDKVAKLARLVSEARHEHIVISDSDVRVRPDYLRRVVAPLADPKIGAVTCFYTSIEEKGFADRLQSVGMLSDFYAGIVVAWQLDGVKFALGPTIATTRRHLEGFGGYAAIENRPADDLLVGRLIAEQGLDVELLPYTVETVADYRSMRDLIYKRLRWIVVMRHMRPWGHFGLLFTQGLPWALVAVAIHPTAAVAATYLGVYFALRASITVLIGRWGLKQRGVFGKLPFIPLWDAAAFAIWVTSFALRSIRWRGADYYIRNGILVPAGGTPAAE